MKFNENKVASVYTKAFYGALAAVVVLAVVATYFGW